MPPYAPCAINGMDPAYRVLPYRAKEDNPMTEQGVKETLRRLGVNTSTQGYSYIAYGVALALEDSGCLRHITKGLYVDIARRFGTSASCVERDIRTAAEAIWRTEDRGLLGEICGGEPTARRPANRELFRMLHGYFTRLPDSGGNVTERQSSWCSRTGSGCPELKALREEAERLREENRRLRSIAGEPGLRQ